MDLARIDEDILQHKAIARTLYYKRNSFIPISRLPTEVLEFIFIRLACHNFYHHSTHHAPAYWFHVSHVSSHWRYVVLNCPLLWSYIFPTSQHWVDLLLERSAQTPLKIGIDLEDDDSCKLSPFIEKILQHAERIKELSFCAFFGDKQTANYFDTLYSSISHLRVLDVSIRFPYWGNSANCSECIPSLHHFSNLSSLTTLRLCFINAHPPFQYDVPGFLSMLSCTPDLVNLYLGGTLASTDDFISSPEFDALQKVDLPHLSRLMVNAPLPTIIAFLSSISIPVHTQIRLDSYSRENLESLDNYERFCSVLARHYSSDRVSSLPRVHFVAMTLDPDNFTEPSFIFSMSPHCEIPSSSLPPDNWPSHILLEIDISPPKSSDIGLLGSNLCAFMPTINVQTLHIYGPPARQGFWRETLGHFPRLCRMKIIGGSMGDDLVSSLLPHNGGRAQASALKKLTLNKMELQMLGDHRKGLKRLPIDGTDLKLPPYQELESLCAALPSRAASQGRLRITKCYVREGKDSYDMVGKWESGHFYVVRERFWSSTEWDSTDSSSD